MEPDRDDDALLVAAADDPEAFARFYRLHVRGVIAYFRRRVGNAELAADLTAETFAAALAGRRRPRRRWAGSASRCSTAPPYGLARATADRLTSSGYSEPNVVPNDTTNQARALTTIYYEPGHKGDAQGVAGCLKIGFDRVVPMDANARALADRAEVAVYIGADRAQ
jgi:hypothetical protein